MINELPGRLAKLNVLKDAEFSGTPEMWAHDAVVILENTSPTNQPQDSQTAIFLSAKAALVTEPGATRSQYLAVLSECLRMHYTSTGYLDSLADAVACLELALEVELVAGREAEILFLMGRILLAQEAATGRPKYVGRAIEVLHRSVSLASTPLALVTLSRALVCGFSHLRHLQLLDEAVAIARTAADQAAGTQDDLSCRTNLAGALSAQWDGRGDIAALREAVGIARAVVRETSPDNPVYPGRVRILSHAVLKLNHMKYSAADVSETIELNRRVLLRMNAAAPSRGEQISILAGLLTLRADRENDDAASDEAIELYRTVVRDHRDEAQLVRLCLDNLTALTRRREARQAEQPATSTPPDTTPSQESPAPDESEETLGPDAAPAPAGASCPRCGGYVPAPVLHHVIRFPIDHELIMQLIEWRFNTTECPTCAAILAHETTVLVWWEEENRLACTLLDEQITAQAEREKNAQVTSCSNGLELRKVIYDWLCEYANPRLRQIHGGLENIPLREAVDVMSPAQLRFWRLGFDAGVGLTFQGDPSPETKELIWGTAVGGHVLRIAEMLARDGRIEDLETELRERVPDACLTRSVIEALHERRGSSGEPASAEIFAGRLLVELAYAHVVRRAELTDVPSPDLAGFVAGVYLSPDEAANPLIRQMLSPSVITPLMGFAELWSVTYALMADGRLGYDDVATLAGRYGYSAAFEARQRDQGFGRAAAGDRARAVQQYRDLIRDCWTNPEEETSDTDMGEIVGRATRILVISGEIDEAESIIDWVLSDLVDSAPGATLAVCTKCLSTYLDLHQPGPARALAERALSMSWLVSYLESAPGLLPARFLIALARCSLDLGNPQRAQEALQHAAEKATAAEINGTASAIDVLYAHRAITHTRATLYRNVGHYGESITLLEHLLEVDPAALAYRLALAKTLLAAGLTKRGIRQLDSIIDDEQSAATSFVVDALCQRSEAHQRLGDDDSAARDLQRAYELAEVINPVSRASIDRGASMLEPVDLAAMAFVGLCLERVRALAAQDDADPGARLNAIAVLIIRAVRLGELDEGRRLLRSLEELAGQHAEDWPWEVLVAAARIAEHGDDLEKCVRYAQRAFGSVLAQLPVGEDASFALGWLGDKEDFQRVLVQTSVRLYDQRMLTDWALLSAYEASNGLEISARAEIPLVSTRDLKAVLEERLGDRITPVSIFFGLDGADETRVGVVYATGGSVSVRLLDERFTRSEVLGAQENLQRTLSAANPADTGRLDGRLGAWKEFSVKLGATIAPWLGEQVVFLGGTSLANLPLHLIPIGDNRTVIDVAPVSYSPNFATLLRAPRELAPTGRAAIMAVSKSNDNERFRDRLRQARKELATSLAELHPSVTTKADTDVTLQTACDILESVDEAVFLCHGTRAGSDGGNGICVSADQHLPPPLFPADDLPSFQKFILSWLNVVDLPAACRYITSIACSSGQTVVGRGGVRMGLEQALLAGRTELIISPLWAVDQESALTWVALFVAHRAQGYGIAEAAREAALQTRNEFPHFYHWGAFTVTGSLPLSNVETR